MARGRKIPEHVAAFVRSEAVKNPRPTNREISAAVVTKFRDEASERSIVRICEAADLPTRSSQAGSSVTGSDRRRLHRFLEAMWIPDPEKPNRKLSGIVEGTNSVHIEDTKLVWQATLLTDDAGRRESRITRCWHTDLDDLWFRSDLLEKLPPQMAEELRAQYDSLQEQACRLISGIRDWKSAREYVDQRQRISFYSDLRRSGTSLPSSDELAMEALFLVDEAPKINGQIAAFTATALAATGA